VITPDEIRLKAARLYLPFLSSWLQGEEFFPRSFAVGELPAKFVDLRDSVRRLLASSKEQYGYGYMVEGQLRKMRNHGAQTLPKRIVIETEQDFLRLIGKEREFQQFQQDAVLIREELPQFEAWMILHPQRIVEQYGVWPDLLAVCAYFLEHPRPDLYLRELPIPVHTKFIEQHWGIVRELLGQILPPEAIEREAPTFEQRFGLRIDEPLIRVRLLDEQLHKQYALSLDDLSIPCSQFAALELLRGQECFVTENKMTFLTLPRRRKIFVIFGGGFMVHNLGQIAWLRECPIMYWGDIDAQGFQILSRLRSLFPHVISLMMDEETLAAFVDFCVEGTPCPVQSLPHLTSEEHALFVHLVESRIRLEQERISHAYAVQRLSGLLGG